LIKKSLLIFNQCL